MERYYDRPKHTLGIEEGAEPPEAYGLKDRLYDLLGYSTGIPWKLLLVIADQIVENLLENHLYAEEAEELSQSVENPAFRTGLLREVMLRLRRDDDGLREVLDRDADDLIVEMEMLLVKNNASNYCVEAVKLVDDEDYEMALAVAGGVISFYEGAIGIGHDRAMDAVFIEFRNAVEGDDIEMMGEDYDEPVADLDRGPANPITSAELSARTKDPNSARVCDRAADQGNLIVLDSLGLAIGGGDLLSKERREELKRMYLEEDEAGNRKRSFSEVMGIAQDELSTFTAGGNRPDHGTRRAVLKSWGDNPDAARDREVGGADVEED